MRRPLAGAPRPPAGDDRSRARGPSKPDLRTAGGARIHHGRLVELVVNAMVGVPEGFLDWDEIALIK